MKKIYEGGMALAVISEGKYTTHMHAHESMYSLHNPDTSVYMHWVYIILGSSLRNFVTCCAVILGISFVTALYCNFDVTSSLKLLVLNTWSQV